MNILLGDISSYKAIVVAKFLKKNYPSIKIFSFDTRKFTRSIYTKYSDYNIIIRDDSITEFLAIIKKYNIDYFFPVINEKLNEIWKNKSIFGDTLNYLGKYEDYSLLNNKTSLYELAKELSILVPEKFETLDEANIPYIVKPTNLSSAKGVIYVNNLKDKPKINTYKDIIIQQYIKGVGVGYSFYCWEGKIINGYGHKRLAEYPITGGSSAYRRHYDDNRMYTIAKKIVSSLNYSGFAMFEFKLTSDNKLYLLEVNPRIWGSINQGLANGYNYFEKILGPVKVTQKIKINHTYTYLGPLIYISLFRYFLKFNIKPTFIFIKNCLRNSADVNMILDLKGYFSILLRKFLK